ncbi:MAG: hypothetical protein Q7L55_11965 [Actinomycetota bacterium]|nr:hypothetical protein [Actinomycetota bacterium]
MSGTSDTRKAAFEEQLNWIREAGGYEREDLTIGVRILFGTFSVPGENRETASQRAVGPTGGRAAGNLMVDELLESPFGLIGNTSELAEHVRKINERYGVTYFTVSEPLAWELGPLIAELNNDN